MVRTSVFRSGAGSYLERIGDRGVMRVGALDEAVENAVPVRKHSRRTSKASPGVNNLACTRETDSISHRLLGPRKHDFKLQKYKFDQWFVRMNQDPPRIQYFPTVNRRRNTVSFVRHTRRGG